MSTSTSITRAEFEAIIRQLHDMSNDGANKDTEWWSGWRSGLATCAARVYKLMLEKSEKALQDLKAEDQYRQLYGNARF